MKNNTLEALLQTTYGMSTRPVSSAAAVAVAITSTKIVSSNPNRVGLTIINTGAANIYILPIMNPAVGNGIWLGAGGGSISLNWMEDMNINGVEWFAIGDGGVSSVCIVENIANG